MRANDIQRRAAFITEGGIAVIFSLAAGTDH
jgi:hypothetical protein